MKVFIDTSAFVALFVDNEKSHQKAAQEYRYYRQEKANLFTSHYILDELFTRLLYYGNKIDIRNLIAKLKQSISRGELKVLNVDEEVFEQSVSTFLKFLEHELSFTDATTFNLCKNHGLDEIFTLDSDFKKIGLQTSF